MLQLSSTFHTATTRFTPRPFWRFTALITNNSSTAATNEQSTTFVKKEEDAKFSQIENNILEKKEQHRSKERESQIKVNLSEKQFVNENDKFDKQFKASRSVNDLLDLAILPNLSRHNALKLISNITNQINSGESQTSNIEADQRFIYLRKIVKASNQIKINTRILSDDLSRYSQLSTPAMIDVIASLREEGTRNTPLLRMLSYNIVKYNMKLGLKQCATLLYSMAVLNFPDKVLLEKIMSDLLECIPKNQTNAVTNKSIITSLGFLQYKNEDVLDAFLDTFSIKLMKYKFQDYISILQTFAVLQYKTERTSSFIEKFVQQVNPFHMSSKDWLNTVWSLTVLDALLPRHAESVLESTFTENLIASKLNVSQKLKLLNINAFAQFALKDYKGPFLDKHSETFNNIPLVRTKSKEIYVNALSETLKKLFPSELYFKTDLDTSMGFLLDAEYRINNKEPILVENWNKQSEDTRRIAIMVHDYHNYCRGQNDLVGSAYLYTQLLKARGYNLITISYENFSIEDKIEKRINYLKQCMKNEQEKKSVYI